MVPLEVPGRELGEPSPRKRILKWLLQTAGLLCTGLAILGIFLPLLPTVPFLLLAAACFARSSEAFHRWLLGHSRFGPLVRAYSGGSIPRRARRRAIALIWISILLSVWLAPLPWVRILLVLIAGGVTWYLLRLPVEV
jgi:uncharacterized membrane protein YbaN (DUF454 family)